MKKFFITILLITVLFTGFAFATETPEVCGNMYGFSYDGVTYMIKFVSSNPELPCTSGTAKLYWEDKSSTYSFNVKSNGIISVVGLSEFAAYNSLLYLLDSTTIKFTIY